MDGQDIGISAAEKCRARKHACIGGEACGPCLWAEIDAALAAARAEEREQACKDVCGGCRYGVELVQTWDHNGQSYDLWLHIDRKTLCVTPCNAEGIHARGTP